MTPHDTPAESEGLRELDQRELQLQLVKYRNSLEMTQTDFAQHYGYESATAVSLWESGQRDIPSIVAIDIFNWLIRRFEHEASRRETAAQTNAVAWCVGVVDDIHSKHDEYQHDRAYKGVKNTIRDRYKAETGIDPAPSYPITAALTKASEGES